MGGLNAGFKVLALAFLLQAGRQLQAQPFDLGVRGDLQTAFLLNHNDGAASPGLSYKDKMYAAAGISGGYTYSKHIGGEVNILYSGQGQGYTGDAAKITAGPAISSQFKFIAPSVGMPLSGNYTASINLAYVKVPLLLRYVGDTAEKIYFSAFAGPQFDLLASAAYTINGERANLAAYNLSSGDVYKKTGVDGVIGVGAGFKLPKDFTLLLQLRADYGFGDAENKTETYISSAYLNPPAGVKYNFYDSGRDKTHNVTAGLLVSVNYKLVKKEKDEHGRVVPRRR